MDAFNVVLLIFTLMILVAILAIPYLILNKIIRVMIRSAKKTFEVIFG